MGLGRIGFLSRAAGRSPDLAAAVAHHFKLPSCALQTRRSADVRTRGGAGARLGRGAPSTPFAAGGRRPRHRRREVPRDAERATRLALPIIDVPHEAAEGASPWERWTDVLADRLAGDGVHGEHTSPAAHHLGDQSGRAPARCSRGSAWTNVGARAGVRYHLFVDGGARGNPGPAGIGARVLETPDGKLVEELADAIGTATNDQAEYQALIAGLELAIDRAVKENSSSSGRQRARRPPDERRVPRQGRQAARPLHTRATHLARELPGTWRSGTSRASRTPRQTAWSTKPSTRRCAADPHAAADCRADSLPAGAVVVRGRRLPDDCGPRGTLCITPSSLRV